MAKLEDLVRYETANSAVAFRELPYSKQHAAQFLIDALALANAEVEGPRFLFVGVRDVVGSERAFPGVDAEAMSEMRRLLPALLARAVEPPFKIAVRALKIHEAMIALLCISECTNAPYLIRKSIAGLPAGIGWLRRGTQHKQLARADLQRLFAQRLPAARAAGAVVQVGFAGEGLRTELELPVLDLAELPSAVVAGRLKQMLEGKKSVKDVLGRTETRFSRLLHAKVFGADTHYESHSDDSLRLMIDATKEEHAYADRHYELAVRAHKLELVVCNRSNVALESVMLRLRLPNLPGLGVADKLYSATGVADVTAGAYPVVTLRERVIDIEASVGTVPPSATMPVFREPPRLWLREPAAGKSIALDYSVHARELPEPACDSLVLRIAAADSKAARSERRRSRARP